MKIILILLLVVAKVIYFQCILLKTCIISELSQLFLFSFYCFAYFPEFGKSQVQAFPIWL